jgi:hypothetical protein
MPNTPEKFPPLPLPPPICGTPPGWFAGYTVTERWPVIGRRILKENHLAPEAAAGIEALVTELTHGTIREIRDDSAPDAAAWAGYVRPYLGQDWLSVPWFFSENYFYRRVIEATGFFRPGPGQGMDPFELQKHLGLEAGLGAIRLLAERLESIREAPDREALAQMIHLSLWGNQADLSLRPAEKEVRQGHQDAHQQQAHLLVDDAPAAVEALLVLPQPVRVNMILDNAGLELVYDLALVDVLLGRSRAGLVQLDLKPHPYFVSDTMVKDVRQTVAFLSTRPEPAVSAFAARLQAYLEEGRLRLRDHFYWSSPLYGWEMPADVYQELSSTALVISKGDANYRRWLGDRHWPVNFPFQSITGYLPAPWLALRVLKSELVTGLPLARAAELSQQDPEWKVDGKWGTIQYFPGQRNA